MENIKDSLVNAWLQAKSYARFFLKAKPIESMPIGTESYSLDFEDTFQGNELNKSLWSIGQPWGEFHPDSPHQYYGKTTQFVNVTNGSLQLFTRYEPKDFYNDKTSSTITIPYGVGLVISKQSFKYGYYEIQAMLPEGKYLWPALWLTAVKTWPPEIDIMEAYSGSDGQYTNGKNLKNENIQPNIHYGFTEDGTQSSYGAISSPIPNKPSKRYVRYGLNWSQEFIKVYYDGYLVFQCTRKEILNYFNRPDVTMTVILNNAVLSQIGNLVTLPSLFKIKSVRFFSKK